MKIYRSKYRIVDHADGNKIVEEGFRYSDAPIPKSASLVSKDRTKYQAGSMRAPGSDFAFIEDFSEIIVPSNSSIVVDEDGASLMVGDKIIPFSALYDRGYRPEDDAMTS